MTLQKIILEDLKASNIIPLQVTDANEFTDAGIELNHGLYIQIGSDYIGLDKITVKLEPKETHHFQSLKFTMFTLGESNAQVMKKIHSITNQINKIYECND